MTLFSESQKTSSQEKGGDSSRRRSRAPSSGLVTFAELDSAEGLDDLGTLSMMTAWVSKHCTQRGYVGLIFGLNQSSFAL